MSFPEIQSGLQAGVDAVNAAGGVAGHPLKLVYCDTQLEVNLELSCTRELIADKVAAVVDPLIGADQSGAELKLLQAAGIPGIGAGGATTEDLTNPDSYPIGSTAVGWLYGAVKLLKERGTTKYAIYGGANTAPTHFAVAVAQAAFKAFGLPVPTVVYGDPASDPSLASSAAKVTAGGVNGILLLPENPVLMIKSLLNAGYKGLMSSVSAQVTLALPSLGDSADGILVTGDYRFPSQTSNAAVAQFLASMKKYQPSAVVDLNSIGGYAAVLLFKGIANTVTGKTVDAAAVKQALNNLSTPINIGLVGPWVIKGRTSPLPTAPRILNPNISYGIVKKGQIVPLTDGFSNPFAS